MVCTCSYAITMRLSQKATGERYAENRLALIAAGWWHPVTKVLRSEPSGFMDKILPSLKSSTNKRPTD